MNRNPRSSIRPCNDSRSGFGACVLPVQLVFLVISLNLAWAMPTYAGKKALPVAPSNLSASTVSSSEIDLNWQDNSSTETGFIIQRATSATGPWSQIATAGANVTSYANTGLNASTTYYYKVCAYNSSGSSGFAGPASATTTAPCTDNITTGVSPAGAGTSTGGGTVNCNSTVTVSASPAAGYSFANWTENGTVVSASSSYSFKATSNRGLMANFTAIPCTFSVSSTNGVFPAAGGNGSINVTASGGGSCNWTAVSGATWITILTGGSGSGSGMASYSLAANTTSN